MSEKPLHLALKQWYAKPDDQFEVPVDGFVIDIVRGDLLIEIQTRNFTAIKPKLKKLVAHHPLRLVYPIAREKWIVKHAHDGRGQLSRRKSPKCGVVEHLFGELVRIPKLIIEPNFSLEVLLIQEEEVRRHDAKRAWRRRGWVTHERRLLKVLGGQTFETASDLAALVPTDLVDPFTTSDLAAALAQPRRLAQRMAYCLREMGAIAQVGKRGRAHLYTRAGDAP